MKKVLYFLFLFILPIVVWAQSNNSGLGGSGGPGLGGSGGPGDSIVISDPLGGGGLTDFFNRIINGLLLLAGPIAVIMLIYAGYLFVTAVDNQEKVKKARSTVLYVVIGIAVLVMSKAIVAVVVNFVKGGS